jgi:hypothetical protein
MQASPETFSVARVPGQKRGQMSVSGRPVFWAFHGIRSTRPPTILFGQEGIIILRGGGRGELCQRIAVIPGHPFRWISLQRRGVPLQLGQIIERIGSVQLAGVDQTLIRADSLFKLARHRSLHRRGRVLEKSEG